MNYKDNQLEPVLVEAFNTLRVTPERNALIAAARRASFLAEAGRLAQTVSDHQGNRHFYWNVAFKNLWAHPRKEKQPMLNFATSLLLVISIFLGSGGAAVAAAQSSLPDEALYPIKTWSEEARLQLAHDDETQLQLELQFINRRMVEIRTMLQSGEVPSDAFMNRLQNQLEYTLRLTANMQNEQATQAFLQIQEQLQLHLQTMTQLHLNTDPDPALLQTRNRIQNMLQQQLHLCQVGLEDPLWLREQLRTRTQEQIRQQLQDGSCTGTQQQIQNQYQNGGSNQDCQNPDCEHNQYQNQFQNGTNITGDEVDITSDNPWVIGTPTPGSSYGPGESQNPWTDSTPTPGSSYGPGESQNPWTEYTPTPGSGYGPGPGPDVTCTPQPSNGPSPDPGGGNKP